MNNIDKPQKIDTLDDSYQVFASMAHRNPQ